MKIGLFADPHYCCKEVTCSTRRPSLSYQKIREAMTAFADAGAELVLCLGDLVDDCDDTARNREEIERISALIRSFGIPFYSLMGNHDYQNFTREEFDRFTGGAYPPFSAVYGRRVFLFLDANYTKAGAVYEPGKVDWVDTMVPVEQVSRLREHLSAARGQEVYVFTHQNLDPSVEEHHIISNSAEVRALLEAAGNVKAVFSGHYHPGHEAVVNGIRYHTLAAMCEGEDNRFEVVELP